MATIRRKKVLDFLAECEAQGCTVVWDGSDRVKIILPGGEPYFTHASVISGHGGSSRNSANLARDLRKRGILTLGIRPLK